MFWKRKRKPDLLSKDEEKSESQAIKLTDLQNQIAKPCTIFEVGGFRPTNEIEESWLGRVTHYLEEEKIPIDKFGNSMMELGQFYLPTLPFLPELLSKTILLTVFISPELEGDSNLMDGCWEVREYESLEGLVRKKIDRKCDGLKPFPLKPSLVDVDDPLWDGGGLTSEFDQ